MSRRFCKRDEQIFDDRKRLGIVAPVIKDRNIGIVGHNPVKKIQHVNTCITSGAFSNLKAWKELVDMMKECLLIRLILSIAIEWEK